MRSLLFVYFTILLSCVPQKNKVYNFAVLSVNNKNNSFTNPLLNSIEEGLEKINQQKAYSGDFLKYHHNWNTGLRLAINSEFYRLILPINILPNFLNLQQSNEILSLIHRYPEQQFALPFELYRRFNILPDNLILNIIYVHETAFLAGIIAATLSKTHKIAIVVENHTPQSHIYANPFIQGIRQVKKNTFVRIVKVSNEQFIATGKSLATSLYQNNFDIIFEISDHNLTSLLQAAVENQGYIITHQQYHQEDKSRIMVELIQRLDKSLQRILNEINKKSDIHKIYYGDLASGDALISWNPHAHTEFVASLDKEQQILLNKLEGDLKKWQNRIISGQYTVSNMAAEGQKKIVKYAADEVLDFN